MRRSSADCHPVDVHVGNRVRLRRSLLGMSQTALGTAVGLTFQQIQKYERGVNRIAASRLFEFAAVLDVPVTYFFDELPRVGSPPPARNDRIASERGVHAGKALISKQETLKLIRSYYMVRPEALRAMILGIIRSLSRESPQLRRPASRKSSKPASRAIQRRQRGT